MEQKLSIVAEAAYQRYHDSREIIPELLFAWLLAEVHFAGTVTKVIMFELGALPQERHEIELLVEIAIAYRYFRKAIERAKCVTIKEDMQAVRPKQE